MTATGMTIAWGAMQAAVVAMIGLLASWPPPADELAALEVGDRNAAKSIFGVRVAELGLVRS